MVATIQSKNTAKNAQKLSAKKRAYLVFFNRMRSMSKFNFWLALLPAFLIVSACGHDHDSATASGAVTATYTLFEAAQGGIVFYLDSNGEHGLVAATDDIATQQQWWINNSGIYAGAVLTDLFEGFQNTALIINSEGINAPAATSCRAYASQYSGWYLPALQELNELYFLQTEIGNFDNTAAYWSSTEDATNPVQAWAQIFTPGGQNQITATKTSAASVRCIRAF